MFKKDALKKMKMPANEAANDEMLMEDGEMEASEEMPMEDEMMDAEAAPSPFADAPDEDLIAELEARGFDVEALKASMQSQGEEEPAEMSEEDLMS